MTNRAEVSGPAVANSDTVIDPIANDQPLSDHSVMRLPNGRFIAGHVPRSPGRPKKSESMPEKLRKRVERDADKVVDAVMKRLTRDDAVGNRAFADVRDTVYGIPKQTLVLEQGVSPADALDAALSALVVQPQTPVLPAPEADASQTHER